MLSKVVVAFVDAWTEVAAFGNHATCGSLSLKNGQTHVPVPVSPIAKHSKPSAQGREHPSGMALSWQIYCAAVETI